MLSFSRIVAKVVTILAILHGSFCINKPYHVRSEIDAQTGHCILISAGRTHLRRDLSPEDGVFVEFKRRVIDHDREMENFAANDGYVVELTHSDEGAVQAELQKYCDNLITEEDFKSVGDTSWRGPVGFSDTFDQISISKSEEFTDNYEVRKIIDSGPPENRVDVVFMGDGYTRSQKSQFFADIERLTNDMFVDITYRSTLPLFNIWAVYVESNESGIGVNGRPKDTAFGLYRDGTELRGIYCSKVNSARRACRLTGKAACDFPTLIGNSPYYGGLGGEFTISTSSETSGTIVLRHEMGHNFINVGEEYDGGYVYSGCNSARSLNAVPWKQWLSGSLREEKSSLLVQNYAWYDLAQGPYKIPFTSDGKQSRWYLLLSASGVEEEGSFEIYLDDELLPWNTSGNLDRSFFSWYGDTGFSAGRHELKFKSGFPPKSKSMPARQLCSVNLHEYADEDKYVWNNSWISAYPTVSLNGRISFRPTNEGCLMRNMTSSTLCSVCKEGLWLQLLKKITLIDEVSYSCSNSAYKIFLKAIPLANLRPEGRQIEGEKYYVRWYQDGVHQSDLDDLFEFERPHSSALGIWKVQLEFVTPEVRVDPKALLSAEEKFSIENCFVSSL